MKELRRPGFVAFGVFVANPDWRKCGEAVGYRTSERSWWAESSVGAGGKSWIAASLRLRARTGLGGRVGDRDLRLDALEFERVGFAGGELGDVEAFVGVDE